MFIVFPDEYVQLNIHVYSNRIRGKCARHEIYRPVELIAHIDGGKNVHRAIRMERSTERRVVSSVVLSQVIAIPVAYGLEEVKTYLALLPEPAATAFPFAAFTGLRHGEIQGLL